MSNHEELHAPWMVAVWPGMGNVALSGGYYLMSKLQMYGFAELSAEGLFDVDSADIKAGLVQPTQRPRNRFFAYKAPEGSRDIVVFIGEAQPPLGKYSFCERLIVDNLGPARFAPTRRWADRRIERSAVGSRERQGHPWHVPAGRNAADLRSNPIPKGFASGAESVCRLGEP